MTELITKLQKYESPLWGYHFPIPAKIAEKYIEGNNRRIICHINDEHKMQCAIMPSKEGFFILINKNLRLFLYILINKNLIFKNHL
jgi:hypothetical protein